MRALIPAAYLAFAALALAGASCSTVSGAADRINPFNDSQDQDPADAPDPERRESFLTFEEDLAVDPAHAGDAVVLPAAVANASWPNEGGVAAHAPGHPAASAHLSRAWRRGVGAGSGRRSRVAAPPVIADGRVFAIDGEGEVVALAAESGQRVWRSRLRSGERRDREFRSGGVAYGAGRIYVTMGFGAVAALDAASGDEVWRAETSGPMHAPPTFADGRVFAITIDNELFAIDAEDGGVLWTYQSLSEPARILTASSPAVSGNTVVAPFASGEIAVLRADNGRVQWADALSRTGRTTALSSLNDIAGSPVIVGDVVYAVSHSGVLAAFDLRTGQRLWVQPAGGIHMPWVAGDYLFIMTSDGDLACLSRADGAVIWIRDVPQYRKPKKRRGRIAWAGPVLAGDRLLLASSEGKMLSIDPATGETVDEIRIGDDVFIPPVVANGTVYVMTDEASLVAYR